MRILLASILPSDDLDSWSGINYHIYHQLKKNHVVDYCYDEDAHNLQKKLARKSHFISKLFSKRLNVYHSKTIAKKYGEALTRKVQNFNPDLVVCLGSGTEIAYANVSVPCYLVADATFKNLQNNYPLYSNLSSKSANQALELESIAFSKFERLFFTSKWARESCKTTYPDLIDKVFPINFGSNTPVPNQVTSKKLPANISDLKLLTVGTDAHRKGIDRCAALEDELDCNLRIIGMSKEHSISKKIDSDVLKLQQAYEDAHFFLMLSRADCTPVVINEASSYGLPVIANNVGGMADIVQQNGILVSDIGEALEYLRKLTPIEYEALRISTRNFYEENLSWNQFEYKLLA